MKEIMFPEIAGSHLAGERERGRALRRYQRIAKGRRVTHEPQPKKEELMSTAKKTTTRGKPLAPKLVQWINSRLQQVSIDRAVQELNDAVSRCNVRPKDVNARDRIRDFQHDNGHRFEPQWHVYLGTWAGFIQHVARVPVHETIEIPAVPIENDPDSGVFEAPEPASMNVSCMEPMQDPEPFRGPNPSALDLVPRSIEFNGRSVRVVVSDRTEPWFVAKDLVEAVGATWKGAQALEHVPAEYRGITSVVTPSGTQQMVCLNESGMNFYLIRSDKPAALPLQKKIASEVLPSIRRTGTYIAPGAVPQLPVASNDERIVGMMTSAMSQVMAPMVQMFSSVLTHLIPGKTDAPAGAADVVDTDSATPLGDYPKPTVDVPERTVRSMLSDLVVVGSGWRPSLPKPQADDVLRQGWSRLYREFRARYQVDIKRCAKNHSERTGKHIDYLDWVEAQSNGVDLMNKLYALAYLLYPPKK